MARRPARPSPFRQRAPAGWLLACLKADAEEEGCWLNVLWGLDEKRILAELITSGRVVLGEATSLPGRENGAPACVVAVLGTASNSPPAWLAAGQALGKILLRARSEEVAASVVRLAIGSSVPGSASDIHEHSSRLAVSVRPSQGSVPGAARSLAV